MRAIVTGGAGFIGSHVVDAVIDAGGKVLVVDDFSRRRPTGLDRARLAQVDIRHGDVLTAAFTDFRPEVVFHLAAQIDVRASMANPAHDASVNVLGSVNVFAAAAASGARRVVNTSTGGAIYGDHPQIPTPETVTPRPTSAYGLSKFVAEQYGDWFVRARGVDVVTLRYGNVYGPRQDPKGDAGVIAIFGNQVLAGETPRSTATGRRPGTSSTSVTSPHQPRRRGRP
jgi:UDP-glucose 4-epimerase